MSAILQMLTGDYFIHVVEALTILAILAVACYFFFGLNLFKRN